MQDNRCILLEKGKWVLLTLLFDYKFYSGPDQNKYIIKSLLRSLIKSDVSVCYIRNMNEDASVSSVTGYRLVFRHGYGLFSLSPQLYRIRGQPRPIFNVYYGPFIRG
jgi:hypothetical protein